MKKWLKRIGIGLAIIILVVCGITYVRFAHWRNEVTKDLERDSTVVQTAKGRSNSQTLGLDRQFL